jgi:predicted transcriptional regulator
LATILDLTSDLVSSHASRTPMTSDELVSEIGKVYASLQALETVTAIEVIEQIKPVVSVKDAFKKNEVICMVCGKGKMKTLTRHLNMVHNMKPGDYRKEFGIPNRRPLTAKSYSESRRKFAEERGLGDVLAKARKIRAAKAKGKKVVSARIAKSKPMKKTVPA